MCLEWSLVLVWAFSPSLFFKGRAQTKPHKAEEVNERVLLSLRQTLTLEKLVWKFSGSKTNFLFKKKSQLPQEFYWITSESNWNNVIAPPHPHPHCLPIVKKNPVLPPDHVSL